MKFSIMDYSQANACRLGLDLTDLLILRWFVDFKGTEKMTAKMFDDKIYYWVNYQYLLDDLPIIKITSRDVLRRRFRKLCEKDILVFHCERDKTGTFTYYNIGKSYTFLLHYSNDKDNNSNKL